VPREFAQITNHPEPFYIAMPDDKREFSDFEGGEGATDRSSAGELRRPEAFNLLWPAARRATTDSPSIHTNAKRERAIRYSSRSYR